MITSQRWLSVWLQLGIVPEGRSRRFSRGKRDNMTSIQKILVQGGRQSIHQYASLKMWRILQVSKPFKGPFCITSVYNNGVDLRSIDKPRSKPIWVAFNRIRWCPKEMQNSEDTRSDSEDADDFEEEVMNLKFPHGVAGWGHSLFSIARTLVLKRRNVIFNNYQTIFNAL